VELLLREVRATKAYSSGRGMITTADAEKIVREHLSKRFGKKYDGEIVILEVFKSVQVSLNSDQHLVVRVYPEINFKYVDEEGNARCEWLSAHDTDTVVVFDDVETRHILRFISWILREH